MRRFHRRPRLIELSMPRQPGEAAILRAWRQKRNALPDDVRAVLAAADLAAERTAARVRLCVLILIGLVLAGLGSLAGVYREWIATIFALNLGVSVARSRAGPPGGLQVVGAMGRGDTRRRGRARCHDYRCLCRSGVGLLHTGSRRLLGDVPAARADCDAFQAGLGGLPRRTANRRPRDGDSTRRTPGGTHPDGRLRRNAGNDI